MVSVFEPSVLCSLSVCLVVSKFSHFSLFHPPLFIQYSTEECSTVQLLASSLEYPQRIEWSQSLNRLSVCSLIVSKFSNFFLFHPSLFIQYSTEECSTVQYEAAGHRTHKTSLRVKNTIPESMRCIVAHSTRSYIGTAVGPLHPALHRNDA